MSLIQHFRQYIDLSATLKKEILNRTRPQVFKKGGLVHDASKICTESHFILKGLLRLYSVKDDKEISEHFFSQKEWVNSPRSFMFRKLDHYYIDAIEVTETFSINIKDLGFLFDNFPEMERYARLSMGSVIYKMLERTASLKFHTAHEKYDHFRLTYKDIHPRIPLGMIASSIGITQETLSRIRTKP